MPRFYFDYQNGQDHVTDLEGLWLESAEHAYIEAVKSIQELLANLLEEPSDLRHRAFHIRGETALLFSVPFSEVLESCR